MKTVFFRIFFIFLCLAGTDVLAGQKNIIGETAWLEVNGVPFLARIDTGARITSLHAVALSITDGGESPDENVGKTVSFKTVNRAGRSQTISAVITRVSTVKNSQGVEKRYVIELPLSWNHARKIVQVNLRDRSKMTYKLLIGRNWLAGDFLVDVDKQAEEKGERQ